MADETRNGDSDETRNGDSKVRLVRLLGHRDDAGAWEIRDFLKRSVVESQWIELSTERTAAAS
jgi:hypothetical protein